MEALDTEGFGTNCNRCVFSRNEWTHVDGLGSVASIIHPYTGVVGRILLVNFSRKVSFDEVGCLLLVLGVVFSFMALVGSKSLTNVEPIRQSHGGVCTVVFAVD